MFNILVVTEVSPPRDSGLARSSEIEFRGVFVRFAKEWNEFSTLFRRQKCYTLNSIADDL